MVRSGTYNCASRAVVDTEAANKDINSVVCNIKRGGKGDSGLVRGWTLGWEFGWGEEGLSEGRGFGVGLVAGLR